MRFKAFHNESSTNCCVFEILCDGNRDYLILLEWNGSRTWIMVMKRLKLRSLWFQAGNNCFSNTHLYGQNNGFHLGINRFWVRVSSSPYGKHHLLFIWINLKFINVFKKARSTVVSTSNHRVISIPTHKIIQTSRLYLPVIMYRLLSVLVWDVPAFQQTRAKKENNGYTIAYSTIWLTIPGEFKNNLNVRVNYNRLVSMTPHNRKIWKNLQKTSYVKTAKYV